MNRKLWLSTLVLALVLVFSVSCGANQGPSSPSTPASSPVMPSGGFTFAGKTIDLIVPSGAGGGLDLTARVYAKILPRYLPGNPAIVVKNMPGGGATIGGNYFYNAKPDGLTLCVG
ncbi:MAG: hypothetical protein HYX90_05000, partial [Chloroflexi bacterium]|nr:hypothetical protein [Chloroflexota bacterium]